MSKRNPGEFDTASSDAEVLGQLQHDFTMYVDTDIDQSGFGALHEMSVNMLINSGFTADRARSLADRALSKNFWMF